MDANELQKYIENHMAIVPKIEQQEAYAKGLNPAIFRPNPKPDPDQRVPIPYCSRAVALLKGYSARPGNIQYSDLDGDTYENTLRPIFNNQDEELITANEFEQGCKHGGMFELHWFMDGEPQFDLIPYSQAIPIWSSDLRPKLLGFIWHRLSGDIELANVYDSEKVYYFELKGNKWELIAEELHGYGVVPVNAGPFQNGWRNLFDHVLPLVDLADRLISQDVANEAERFNSALLVIKNRLSTALDSDGLSDVDKVKLWRILDGSEDPKNEAAFITRDIPTDFIDFAFKTVDRLIYEGLQMPNPNDDNFATASGVAQRFKLLSMEYLFASIEPYFVKFLQNRIKMICNHVLIRKPWDTVQINIIKNLPANEPELVKMAIDLSAITSRETALRALPKSLVPDLVKELETIKADSESASMFNREVALVDVEDVSE